MKNIRKAQTECHLLSLITNNSNLLDKNYTGYIFDHFISEKGKNSYYIYINELNMISNYKVNSNQHNCQLEPYKEYEFKLYHFKDKTKLKDKIIFNLLI